MPAASCPRCWSAWRPSAVSAPASAWPKMPKTPHSSRSLSSKGWAGRVRMSLLSGRLLHRLFRPLRLGWLLRLRGRLDRALVVGGEVGAAGFAFRRGWRRGLLGAAADALQDLA